MGKSGLRKPWWGWKSRFCAELEVFDISFAVKEYCQNQVGQVLKALQTRVWSEWERRDLTRQGPLTRQLAKADLEATYLAMFAGPHGAALRHDDWLPLYIVEATIPQDRIRDATRDTDLALCTVLWEHEPTGLCGLSFFNNHLDANASFSSFVVDGQTTSRSNEWAVGEKGKGFVLATQYFFEEVEQTVGRSEQSRTLKQGVSFRIGHEVGELKWKKSKHDLDQLKVIKDDLTPTDLAGLMARRGLSEDDSSDGWSGSDRDEPEQQSKTLIQSAISTRAARSLKAVYKRRFKYKMSEKNAGISEPSSPAHETSFVSKDEVSITILGLPWSSPSEVFSGVYGIIPPEKAWSLPDSKVQFFKLAANQVRFYLRDQIIPCAPTLNILSVNYQGDMEITSDRSTVKTHGHKFEGYCRAVGEAADKAFRQGGSPELATELALEILREEEEYSAVSIQRLLNPANSEAGGGYRAAFNRAWKVLKPDAPSNVVFWPFTETHPDDLEVIEELGMVGCEVSRRVMRILETSGAYTRIRPHTKTLLLAALELKDEVPGLERFRWGLKSVLGQDHLAAISMREYSYSTPKILWHPDSREFVFALPDPCEEHEVESGCLCWVGPVMFEAVENWKATQDGPGPSISAICRALTECMEGVVGMYEPEDEVDDQIESGDGSNSSSTASSSSQKARSYSTNEDSSDSSSPPRDPAASPRKSSQSGSSRKPAPVFLRRSQSISEEDSSGTSDSVDLMDKFTALSSHVQELGVLLQQQNDTSKTERAQIVDLNAQLEDLRQKLHRKRKELERERQTTAAAKAQLEREKEEVEDKLEHTQQLLQGQWSARSDERKAKRRREE